MPTIRRPAVGAMGAEHRLRPVRRVSARSVLASPLWLAPLFALAITAFTFQSASVAGARQSSPTTAPNVGQIYLSDCGVCHGADGKGTDRGPTLAGVGRASLDYELSTGRMPLAEAGRADDVPGAPVQPLPNTSPAEPDVTAKRHTPAYRPEIISQLIDYAWNLTGRGGPDIPHVGHGDVAEGGALFRVNCAACHAWAGDGGALVRFQSPALHNATEVQIAEAVRVGPGQMPAFGDAALTEEQLAGVVAYVRYLGDPQDRGGQPLWHLGPFAEGAMSLVALGGLLVFTRWIGERG